MEAASDLVASIENVVENFAEADDGASSAASSSSGSGSRRPRRPRARFHMTQSGGPISDQFIQSLIANLIGGPRGPGGPDLPPGAIHIATAGNGGRGGGFPGIFQVSAGGGGPGGIPMMAPLYGNPGTMRGVVGALMLLLPNF